MKNLFTSTLLVVCVSTVFAQYTAIPDSNFEQRLIALGWDDVLDGQVLTANISSRTSLDVSDRGITDLTGIKAFTSLTTLNCSLNPITNLDLSGMANLQTLTAEGDASTNSISSCTKCLFNLDVSGCSSLSSIKIGANLLQTLNLNCPNLTYLECYNNLLTSVDLSLSPLLTYLNIGSINYWSAYGSEITSLDLSNNPLLETVMANYCYDLQNINLTACTNLKTLELYNNNNLQNIDLSSCVNLENLVLHTNVNELDLSNNTKLSFLNLIGVSISYLNLNNLTNLVHMSIDYVDSVDASQIAPDHIMLRFISTAKIDFSNANLGLGGDAFWINTVDCIQVFGSKTVAEIYDEAIFAGPVSYMGTEPCDFIEMPDSNFENALINLGYDAVQNGSVTSQAIQPVTNLNVSNKNITDFTGLEGFTSIENLDISGNKVANLDFSNSILKTPANSTLQTLNISNSPNLVSVDLSTNDKLTSISASNNPVLENMKLNFKVLNTGSSDIVNNPNLECIQVFDKDASTITTGAWIDSQITLTNSSCNPLGLSEMENTIGIVPNPFSAEIQLSNYADVASLSVFDINGRLLVSINNPSKTIDLSHLENGSYFLQIITKLHFKYHSQIIKQ